MTFLEWPIIAHGVKWGKQAFGMAQRGAATVAHLAALDTRIAAVEKLDPRVAAVETQAAALELRLATLEKSLEIWPPDVCKSCGHRAMRRIIVGRVFERHSTNRMDVWRCENCQTEESRIEKF